MKARAHPSLTTALSFLDLTQVPIYCWVNSFPVAGWRNLGWISWPSHNFLHNNHLSWALRWPVADFFVYIITPDTVGTNKQFKVLKNAWSLKVWRETNLRLVHALMLCRLSPILSYPTTYWSGITRHLCGLIDILADLLEVLLRFLWIVFIEIMFWSWHPLCFCKKNYHYASVKYIIS